MIWPLLDIGLLVTSILAKIIFFPHIRTPLFAQLPLIILTSFFAIALLADIIKNQRNPNYIPKSSTAQAVASNNDGQVRYISALLIWTVTGTLFLSYIEHSSLEMAMEVGRITSNLIISVQYIAGLNVGRFLVGLLSVSQRRKLKD